MIKKIDIVLLILVLCIFILLKINHLNIAFYWDESWVYAPAIKLLYQHGVSMMPNAIPVDFSRGHPLLFHAAYVVWMKVFGSSNLSMHCLALGISVLLAVVLFISMYRLFGRYVAWFSLALLLTGKVFFVESSFVLNDIALGLFAFLSIIAYCHQRYFSTAIYLTILVFIKESGMVAVAVITVDMALGLLIRRITFREAMARSVSVFIPVLFLVAYFVVQKSLLGWYLYPGHTSIINFGIDNTLNHLLIGLSYVFFYNQMYCCYAPLIVLSVFAAFKNNRPVYTVVPVWFALLYVFILYLSSRDFVYYIFIGLTIAGIAYLLVRKWHGFSAIQERFIKLSLSFVAAFTYFCCINFWESRYLFPEQLFVSAVLLPVFCNYFIVQPAKDLLAYVVAFSALSGIQNFKIIDDEQLIFDRIATQQAIVNYCVSHKLHNKHIYTKAYLQMVHLRDPNTGFLPDTAVFRYVSNQLDSATEYFIFDNIEVDPSDFKIQDTCKPALVYSFHKGTITAGLFRRVTPVK